MTKNDIFPIAGLSLEERQRLAAYERRSSFSALEDRIVLNDWNAIPLLIKAIREHMPEPHQSATLLAFDLARKVTP